MYKISRKGKQYFLHERTECFEKKKWGENERRYQVGGSIIAPGEEEEETKLTFFDFESLCYVDAFTLFCWKFASFSLCFLYHLFGIESLIFFS